jgi:hypothetical protein
MKISTTKIDPSFKFPGHFYLLGLGMTNLANIQKDTR